jgi:hypothetical protein
MKNAFLSSLVCLLSVSAFAETKSVYTDMKTDCIVVSSATDKAPIDFFESECKSYGGYSLKENGGDLRYGPELSFNGTQIDLQRPGHFHNLGSEKIEWVYDLARDEEGSGKLNFKALIYRLSVANEDPDLKDSSVLYVVRLDKQKSCIIGTAKTNEAARELANNKTAKCASVSEK